jgi:hypothetical protein
LEEEERKWRKRVLKNPQRARPQLPRQHDLIPFGEAASLLRGRMSLRVLVMVMVMGRGIPLINLSEALHCTSMVMGLRNSF